MHRVPWRNEAVSGKEVGYVGLENSLGGEAGGGGGDFRVRALVGWSGSLGVAVLCMTLYGRMVAFQPQGPLLPVVAH